MRDIRRGIAPINRVTLAASISSSASLLNVANTSPVGTHLRMREAEVSAECRDYSQNDAAYRRIFEYTFADYC